MRVVVAFSGIRDVRGIEAHGYHRQSLRDKPDRARPERLCEVEDNPASPSPHHTPHSERLAGGSASIQAGINSLTISRSSLSSLTVAAIRLLANSLIGSPCTISTFFPSLRIGNEQIRFFSRP